MILNNIIKELNKHLNTDRNDEFNKLVEARLEKALCSYYSDLMHKLNSVENRVYSGDHIRVLNKINKEN